MSVQKLSIQVIREHPGVDDAALGALANRSRRNFKEHAFPRAEEKRSLATWPYASSHTFDTSTTKKRQEVRRSSLMSSVDRDDQGIPLRDQYRLPQAPSR
jgi:hypothetical protein